MPEVQEQIASVREVWSVRVRVSEAMKRVFEFLLWIPYMGVLGFVIESVCSAIGFRLPGEQEPVWFAAICFIIVAAYLGYEAIQRSIDTKVKQAVEQQLAEKSRKERPREYFGE